MDITVSGRKMPITDALRNYAEDKIGGAVEQLDVDAIACEIVLFQEKNKANPTPAICEVTVIMKGHTPRVQVREEDMYAAIDVAAAKITRQLRKAKTKLTDKRKRQTEAAVAEHREDAKGKVGNDLDLDKLMDELSDDEIVRRKTFHPTPMTEDEALTEIDLIGHDFYVYTDRDTNKIHVLYRRNNGGYGLLVPSDDDE